MLSSNEVCYIITFVIYAVFSTLYTVYTALNYYMEVAELKLLPQKLRVEIEEDELNAITYMLECTSSAHHTSNSRLYKVMQACRYDPKTRTALFFSTRANIYHLKALLQLLKPAFRTYPFNQVVTAEGIHYAILTALVQVELEQNPKAIGCPEMVTNNIMPFYNSWCKVLDSYTIFFGTTDQVEEILYNCRFHMERAGYFRRFPSLPAELKLKILTKVPLQQNKMHVRENGKFRRLLHCHGHRPGVKPMTAKPFLYLNAF
ncbi:unnamed protein product [Bursaphelenchus xylophilus]|uniref:(pine wood nematode) hypothetical protein n=1 Tax=Bursaphelenchus xylophilus TaxID=6326 RepID=A0A1I7S6B1_BURXY|nr:unnamed protein product [Bursaphelenchus xylophilus]CAG9128177.1 unnamed protein product [Bursaphelenchus xylophilus]